MFKFIAPLLIIGGLQAQTIGDSRSFEVEISQVSQVEAITVETREACIFTIDRQFQNEVETRRSKSLIENSDEVRALEKDLRSRGFVWKGYQGQEGCGLKNNTFPKVVNSDGDIYFSRLETNENLMKTVNDQNAFKTVRRVYTKGLSKLKNDVLKKLDQKKSEILNQIL